MRTSENINELAKAMAVAQGEMKPAVESAKNTHFKKSYSTINDIIDCTREPLSKNGLSVWQNVTVDQHGVSITTRVAHESGQWMEFGPLSMPLATPTPQSIGSVITYGKRYALCAALGVSTGEKDDDAEEAEQPFRAQQAAKSSAKPQEEAKVLMISAIQANTLESMVRKDDSEYLKRLLIHFKIPSFRELPADKYESARVAIEKHNRALVEEEMAKKPEEELPF
ncbi:MAG: ERF family protein [Simkania sp.]|nr:ERF family protein [Simkania sp.]